MERHSNVQKLRWNILKWCEDVEICWNMLKSWNCHEAWQYVAINWLTVPWGSDLLGPRPHSIAARKDIPETCCGTARASEFRVETFSGPCNAKGDCIHCRWRLTCQRRKAATLDWEGWPGQPNSDHCMKFALDIHLISPVTGIPRNLRIFATRTLHTSGGWNLFWERLETLNSRWELYSTHLCTSLHISLKTFKTSRPSKPLRTLSTPPGPPGHSPKCAWPRKLHWSFSTSPRPAWKSWKSSRNSKQIGSAKHCKTCGSCGWHWTSHCFLTVVGMRCQESCGTRTPDFPPTAETKGWFLPAVHAQCKNFS